MTRAFDDKTSTCGSCSYWEHNPSADGIHPTRLGWCNWTSVPAWVEKLRKAPHIDHQKMRDDEGRECWLHTKRGLTLPEGAVERAVMRVRNHPLKIDPEQDNGDGQHG